MAGREVEIDKTARQVLAQVLKFLAARGGHARASDVLRMLEDKQRLPQPLARSALWLMLEQGQLNLGKGMELKAGE